MEITQTQTTDLALTDLAGRINDEHRLAENAARSAVEHAVKAGELLIEAKGRCKSGTWMKWLEVKVDIAPRTVRLYMQISRELPKLPDEERQRVANSPLRQAWVVINKDLRERRRRGKRDESARAARADLTPPEDDPEAPLNRNDARVFSADPVKEDGSRGWMIETPPNDAGRRYHERFEVLRQNGFKPKWDKFEALSAERDRAMEERRRLGILYQEADKRYWKLNSRVNDYRQKLTLRMDAELSELHGEPRIRYESEQYTVDPETSSSLMDLETVPGMIALLRTAAGAKRWCICRSEAPSPEAWTDHSDTVWVEEENLAAEVAAT